MLIVGLGNPGKQYEHTRHNVGFMMVDALTEKVNSGQWTVSRKFQSIISLYSQPTTHNSQLIIAKPQTFMNDSGIAVSKVARYYHLVPSALFIVHDDLDIKLGEYKIQKGVGPKIHNGVNSIEEKLGTKDFWRVRVGIENRNKISDTRYQILGQEFVLQDFNEEEKLILKEVIDSVVKDLISRLDLTT